jgi:hypothetical protein
MTTGSDHGPRGIDAGAVVKGMTVAALVYVSGDTTFPAFRRWCLECAAGDAAMADCFAAMTPSALQKLAEALSGEDPKDASR